MKYVLYANGMPFDGDTINDGRSLGGSETMAYYVAKELASRGNSVVMFCNMPEGQPKTTDGVNYIPIGPVDQQSHPFGMNYERYIAEVPCDVHIAQRVPGIFARSTNAKLNYFWMHDLALKRYQGGMNSMLWNTDKILGVSGFHQKQIMEVYGLQDDIVDFIPNGVDLSLWDEGSDNPEAKIASKTMLYAARPERGLVNLVKSGGIMEKLNEYDSDIKLLVCGYDNQHPQMKEEYDYLYGRCEQLPNVQNIGFLSKEMLAQVEKNSWVYVYPTEFEDTSCIMAMENAAAGTPFIACPKGALGETAEGSGAYWANLDAFEKAIVYLNENPDKWKSLHRKSLKKAKDYSVTCTVDKLESMIGKDFEKLVENKQKLYEHFVYTSEIYGADKLASEFPDDIMELRNETRYKTYQKEVGDTVDFYELTAQRNFDLGNEHGMGDPAQLLNMGRLQPVIARLSALKPDAHVLDYGCCVGQLTFALKIRFPDMTFTSVDISASQIEVGRKYAEDNNIEGIDFLVMNDPYELNPKAFDAVICLEVLEHVWDYQKFLKDISEAVVDNGPIIISTPLGPFEENSLDPDPLYQHLHNFEEQDIIDIASSKKVTITYIGEGDSLKGEKLGNYVWIWDEDHKTPFGDIDWEKKFGYQRPREQVSTCMIIRPDGDTLQRCLKSVIGMTDELIVGVDDPDWIDKKYLTFQDYMKSSDKIAYKILDAIKKPKKVFHIESPVKQGFSEARNSTIDKAVKDWVFWIDDDETFVWPERFNRFLRANRFTAYAINHHHISADPVGLLKTDYPTRIFRANAGIRFFGIVHEHPEISINEGPGQTFMVPREMGCVMHYGYETEEIRRRRFSRNYPLMIRERTENPERKLGKFLWIRDIAHINRFNLEQSGGRPTPKVMKNAREAIDLWRSELSESTLRIVADSMPYISECVSLITNNGGIQFSIGLNTNSKGLGDQMNDPLQPIFQGMVEKEEDLEKLFDILLKGKLNSANISAVYV